MAGMTFTGNTISSPRWLADFESPDNILPIPARLDATQFTSATGVNVTLTANAAASATSITVTALAYPFRPATSVISGGSTIIPAGTTLYFGGAKIAVTTAAAPIGATTIAVAALPTALVSGDTATYNQYGTLYVPSGTVIGRTVAEQVANTNYGPAVNTDDQIFVTRYDTVNALSNPDVELVRPNTAIKVNYLPGYGTGLPLGTLASPTALLTALRAKYNCIVGKD